MFWCGVRFQDGSFQWCQCWFIVKIPREISETSEPVGGWGILLNISDCIFTLVTPRGVLIGKISFVWKIWLNFGGENCCQGGCWLFKMAAMIDHVTCTVAQSCDQQSDLWPWSDTVVVWAENQLSSNQRIEIVFDYFLGNDCACVFLCLSPVWNALWL